jgi:hypothetical protein
MGSKAEHGRILNDTLILLGKEAHHLGRFFRNETGSAYRDVDGERVWIKFGVLGSPDIWGILCNGQYIGIEIKSGAATQQDNQKAFEKMVKKFNGHYFVARSASEALSVVIHLCKNLKIS